MISNKIVFLSLKTGFDLANCVDPDKMPRCATFCLGFHCLSNTQLGINRIQWVINEIFLITG